MVYVTGDMHGNISALYNYFQDECLTKDDILIVLGDFGVIWNNKDLAMMGLQLLSEKKCTIAFVDGNHEGYDLLKEMEEDIWWNGDRAGLLPYGIIHLYRGSIYTIEGKTFGVCGGADSVDKALRVEGSSWWVAETIAQSDVDLLLSNAKKYDNHLDYMLTHDAPENQACFLAAMTGISNFKTSTSQQMLTQIQKALKIDKWFFGHWHMNLNLPGDSDYMGLYQKVVELR